MKKNSCNGFENYPCYNGVKHSEFQKALSENREMTAWICNGEQYWQSSIDLEERKIIRITDCFDCPKSIKDQKINNSLKPREKDTQTFENFDGSRLQKPEIINKIKSFPNSEYKNLLLIGKPGVGKTHLANALINQISHEVKNKSNLLTAKALYDLFFESIISDTLMEAKQKIKELHESWYLFIDDLGDERHTEKEVFNSEFKPFIDLFQGRFVITSNLNYSSMIKIYGEKITDRLYQNALIIPVNASNYRLKDFPLK